MDGVNLQMFAGNLQNSHSAGRLLQIVIKQL